jgi:hypothetical protein
MKMQTSQSHKCQPWQTYMPLIATAVAGSVSIVAIVLAGGHERRLQTLATVPFGWNRVIVIHALAALPLSWALSHGLIRCKGLTEKWATALWFTAGVLTATLTVLFGNIVGQAVASAEPGYVCRLVFRTGWCVAIQVPWCSWGFAAASSVRGQPPSWHTDTHRMAWAGLVAFGLPGSFLAIFVPQQVTRAVEQWRQERLRGAHEVVQRLFEIGSQASLGDRGTSDDHGGGARKMVTPRVALTDLNQAIQYVSLKAQELASVEQTADVSLQRAALYRSLDKMVEAEEVLQIFAARVPTAALVLAQFHLEQDRDESCLRYAELALRLARETRVDAVDAQAETLSDEIQVQAYFLLALFAGKTRDLALAERYLVEALEQIPSFSADIHAKLAKHYEFTGQLYRSREHQRMAAKLAPTKYHEPRHLAMMVISTGAPIGLTRPQSSTYR